MATDTMVSIPVGEVRIDADLVMPESPRGVVLFAHGSGSSRHSPRNRRVAGYLQEQGFGTVMADLLTPDEEEFDARGGELRFDIGLLGARMVAVVDWAITAEPTRHRMVGLFGASTGAAAALVAAAERDSVVQAVVSRGGRPDLAGEAALLQVRAPTLLIVGGSDPQVWVLNQEAAARISAPCELHVVAGAGHLFEEPGALAEVSEHAAQWFADHLG
ncbi:dienelactone hydrolase family protein [Natronosporangium hydrolyticum]|uniref:Dienelactone hydrolase family protein n=1 Tax=Natronosporangium hydrolyticum TaxID=2811111 RepID=A0A895YB42_9ACTN|nr:dienelactone hydrolase family protein [Natronosporangium hydrolyticum]QSB15004.1 dienelactone hydrolase family protein [Natronosporangium hydrolyticum]